MWILLINFSKQISLITCIYELIISVWIFKIVLYIVYFDQSLTFKPVCLLGLNIAGLGYYHYYY